MSVRNDRLERLEILAPYLGYEGSVQNLFGGLNPQFESFLRSRYRILDPNDDRLLERAENAIRQDLGNNHAFRDRLSNLHKSINYNDPNRSKNALELAQIMEALGRDEGIWYLQEFKGPFSGRNTPNIPSVEQAYQNYRDALPQPELSNEANLALITENFIGISRLASGASPVNELDMAIRAQRLGAGVVEEIASAYSVGADANQLLEQAMRDDYSVEDLISMAGIVLNESDDYAAGEQTVTPVMRQYLTDLENLAAQEPVDHARIFETTLQALAQIETNKMIGALNGVGTQGDYDRTASAELDGSTRALMVVAYNMAEANDINVQALIENVQGQTKNNQDGHSQLQTPPEPPEVNLRP